MISGERLPTLTGERVTLRWLTPDDVDDLFAIFSDPEVMRFWSTLPYESIDKARELQREIEQCFARKNLFQWGIARRSDNRVIGTCTLSSIDPSNLRAELGYALARSSWGQGLMGEALRLLLDFAFGQLALRRLEADVDPANQASIRSLERLGFQREGFLRERWFIGGEAQDALFFGLLRREWEARRRP